MAVFTFSTPDKFPQEEELIKRIKAHCRKHHLNFSGIVLECLRKYEEEKLSNEVQ